MLPLDGASRRGPLLPIRLYRRRLSSSPSPRLFPVKLLQAEIRTGSTFKSAAISSMKRFAGETARDVAGRAQIARAQGNRLGKMPVDQLGDNLLIGHSVNFTAALRAVVAAGIGRSDADLQRSEQRRRAGSGPGLAVIGEIPGDELCRRRQRRLCASSSCAGPLGSQPCSSWRDHWTRTGAPTARESNAASSAPSSVLMRP